MPIRLVAVDLDGTLLTDEMELCTRTGRAIAAIRRLGVKVVIATGRPFPSARPYAIRLGVNLLVPYNGAQVRDVATGSFLLNLSLTPETAAGVVNVLETKGFSPRVYARDHLLVPRLTDEVLYLKEKFGVPVRAVGRLSTFLASVPGAGVDMVTVRGGTETLEETVAEVARRFAGEVVGRRPNPHALDFVSVGAGKEAALRTIAGRLGVEREEVMAVGDGENDIAMLRWAGIGVAMANAGPELLAAADWIAPDNNHAGVAAALERFVPAGR